MLPTVATRERNAAVPYAVVNDIRMYYEEMGSGTPFVLMHAAAGAIDDPVYGWSI